MLGVIVLAMLVYRLFGFDHQPIYRLDIDMYRLGGRAWLNDVDLYGTGGANKFTTQDGTHLAFTYPPAAAILFAGFAVVSAPAASSIITAITMVLLPYAIYLVLDGLDVWPSWTVTGESPAVRRAWLALIIAGIASFQMEPVRSNFGYGQINVVLMAMVLADCLPRRTLLRRGVLVGCAMAIKLTPAVFILYFAVKRDWRAVRTSLLSFCAVTGLGFIFAWRDSVDYWTGTVGRTAARIADIRLNTNQNILSFVARTLPSSLHQPLWLLASFLVLVMVLWAMRRAVAAGHLELAVGCAALLELATSPISWTHHWVWVLPISIWLAVIGYRQRNLVFLAMGAAGLVITKWPRIEWLPSGHESLAPLWRQVVGVYYLWWGLAVIVSVGLTAGRSRGASTRSGDRVAGGESCPDIPERGSDEMSQDDSLDSV